MFYAMIVLATLFAGTSMAQNAPVNPVLYEVFDLAAQKAEVPTKLLYSICWAESHLKQDAYAHNDGLADNHAFGACQILYKTAIEMGMKKDSKCERDFRSETEFSVAGIKLPEGHKSLPRTEKTCRLFSVYNSAYYAGLYLKKKLKQYDNSWISGIAAYNTGTLKVCKTGFVYRAKDQKVLYTCQKGGLLNQKYVDKILGFVSNNFQDEKE